MNISFIVIPLLFLFFGISLVALYIRVAKRRFGVTIDPIQSILYRVDATSLSAGDRILEFVLRMLKHFGILLAVISVVMLFAGDPRK